MWRHMAVSAVLPKEEIPEEGGKKVLFINIYHNFFNQNKNVTINNNYPNNKLISKSFWGGPERKLKCLDVMSF